LRALMAKKCRSQMLARRPGSGAVCAANTVSFTASFPVSFLGEKQP
jgi:hypothetical protein